MLKLFRLSFAVLCLAKGIDIATRGPESLGLTTSLVIAALWAAASVCLAAGYRVRLSSVTIIVLASAITVLSKLAMYNQHLYLIASICLIFVIGQAVPTLLRAQLSIAYGFAALAKINEAFLSGTVVYASAIQRPFWDRFVNVEPSVAFLVTLSAVAICVEGFLAVGFWFPRARWVALVMGVGFHVGMLITMSDDWGSLLRLGIFGFLMIALYIPFFEDRLDGTSRSTTESSVSGLQRSALAS